MKLVPMEVNYYLENPVMDIETEPANYAYRYRSSPPSSSSTLNNNSFPLDGKSNDCT